MRGVATCCGGCYASTWVSSVHSASNAATNPVAAAYEVNLLPPFRVGVSVAIDWLSLIVLPTPNPGLGFRAVRHRRWNPHGKHATKPAAPGRGQYPDNGRGACRLLRPNPAATAACRRSDRPRRTAGVCRHAELSGGRLDRRQHGCHASRLAATGRAAFPLADRRPQPDRAVYRASAWWTISSRTRGAGSSTRCLRTSSTSIATKGPGLRLL